jgi:HEAT repeat protein
MKKSIKYVSIFLTAAVVLSFTNTFAQDKVLTNFEVIESNLLVGLEVGNDGLTSSCTYFLGELKSDKAVIPLMAILHDSDNQKLRQAAVLALYKINSDKGLYAIKQAMELDDNAQTRKISKILYYQSQLREMDGEIEVEPLFVVDIDAKYGEYALSDFNF